MYLSFSNQTYRKHENAGSSIIVQIAKATEFQFTGLFENLEICRFATLNFTGSCEFRLVIRTEQP